MPPCFRRFQRDACLKILTFTALSGGVVNLRIFGAFPVGALCNEANLKSETAGRPPQRPHVYSRARHVPLPHAAVNDAMAALLDSLESEREPIVRAVLGHWLFGFIHPYMDGNGRMARFLMNVMMASGGYPWTIVRTTRRKAYLDVLEAASAEQNILPFANFVREEMSVDWSQQTARM